MKILTVVGARPQFIKAAALSREFALHSSIQEVMVHTGQHFDDNMSGVFFREMEIPEPAYHLGIHSLSNASMTAAMMINLDEVYQKEKPDLVLVFGDTNSTLAGAQAAAAMQIPIAHVEAGLRSFNTAMPEEINRVLTDRISDYLFCPTAKSVQNLINEGFNNTSAKIIQCGDVMLDAMNYYAPKALEKSNVLNANSISDNFILCTLHRASNTDSIENLQQIISAINSLNSEIQIVFSVHPRTRKKMNEAGINCKAKLIDPVSYFDMIQLLTHSKLVMTDSGGLQKEAFFCKKPCVTLRDETEWTELVDAGYNVLAGVKSDVIIETCRMMLNKKFNFSSDFYGSGDACRRIAECIL